MRDEQGTSVWVRTYLSQGRKEIKADRKKGEKTGNT